MANTPSTLTDQEAADARAALAQYDAKQAADRKAARQAQLKDLFDIRDGSEVSSLISKLEPVVPKLVEFSDIYLRANNLLQSLRLLQSIAE